MIIRTIPEVYGDDEPVLHSQRERYARLNDEFLVRYGSSPTAVYRTPGRINLIGEHTDYNGGYVLPVALDKDVLYAVRARDDPHIRGANVETQFAPFAFKISTDIPSAPHGEWSNYCRGAAQGICRRFGANRALRGMDVCVSGAPPQGVPRGSGLSSSTALTVTAALALSTLNEIDVGRPELAHLCSEAEWYVGTRGGMMDQFSALLGMRDHALFLDCRPTEMGVYHHDHVPMPAGAQVVLLNSGVRHENVRSEFNKRVAECKVGVQLLRRDYPSIRQLRDVTPQTVQLSESDFWAMLEDRLPIRATWQELVKRGLDERWLTNLTVDHRLDADAPFVVLPRCRHVIRENERVLDGIAALRAGQLDHFGSLMDAAHASMSRDYGASCPEVDALVDIVRGQPGVLGSRITGAGWGGGVVVLARSGYAQNWGEAVRTAYGGATGLNCEMYVCRPGDGAGQVQPV
jgi:galactokinase